MLNRNEEKRQNLLFTICARAGSKGVQGKNVREFREIPLAAYTVAAFDLFKARFEKEFGQVALAVNTDSDTLIQQIDRMKTKYIYVPRTDALAGDVVAKKDVIKDTMIKCEKETGVFYDVVMDLDLTSPLRTVDDIRGTLKALEENEKADIAYSVTCSRRSPYFNMVIEKGGYYSTVIGTKFTTRQQCPQCFDMNASIYAYRREYLIADQGTPRRDVIWQMKDTGILDIDSEEDLELMEVLAGYFYQNYPTYREIREVAEKLLA